MDKRKNWTIEGYEKTELTVKKTVHLDEAEVKTLLQHLVCMNLAAEEIIWCAVHGGDHFEVHRSPKGADCTFSCGTNPHYVAILDEG